LSSAISAAGIFRREHKWIAHEKVVFTRFSRENPVILLGEYIYETRAALVPK
jgi:hypothetical protein